MKEEVKEGIKEILLKDSYTPYEGYITDTLNNLKIYQEKFEESSNEYRILFNIIDSLEEYENDDLSLLSMQDILLSFVKKVEEDEFLPIITDRDTVIRTLLNK